MARPPEVHWAHLDKMAFLIDGGASPDEAANEIASNPAARLALRMWDPAEKRYRREPTQQASLVKLLKRQWQRYEPDVRRRLEERARTPYSACKALWEVYRWQPEMEIDADTLRTILAERSLINDTLLDAIAELIERASAGSNRG